VNVEVFMDQATAFDLSPGFHTTVWTEIEGIGKVVWTFRCSPFGVSDHAHRDHTTAALQSEIVGRDRTFREVGDLWESP
jgi:hypothetical protein